MVELINNKEHMNTDGLQKIINLKASLNTGNSCELKALFPRTIPVVRPLVKYTRIPDPHWLTGFTEASPKALVVWGENLPYLVGKARLTKVEREMIKLPWWTTGFVDAEGCFRISIRKNKKLKTDWSVSLIFQIGLHDRDQTVLELIKSSLGVGKIYKHSKDMIQLRVESVNDLLVIINHFNKYPLITQKRADFELFKQAYELIQNKEHLTVEGLNKLVAIKAPLNWGLPDNLIGAFPNIKLVPRPLVLNQSIPDSNWLAGFVSGEGCFFVTIKKSDKYLLGESVQLRFQITQHSRDEQLLRSLISYLGCGRYSFSQGRDWGDFVVTKFSDLTEKVIPFFEKSPIVGVKSHDFEDFKKVSKLMKEGAHLTQEGLEEIKQIKAGMNKVRK